MGAATAAARLPPFAGAVLTGGASRRMGRDKALVDVGGRPMAAVVAGALRVAGASPVLAVGGAGAALAGDDLVAVADDHPGEGPLGGVITALAHTDGEVVVVLACDLPATDPHNVRLVVAALAGTPGAQCAVPVVDGRLQGLHAAWRRSALAPARAAFASGERAVHRLLEQLDTVAVPGLDPAAFVDVDAPEALRRARLVARPQHRPDWRAMSDEKPPEIDVSRLADLQSSGAWVLDVRQPDEYEEGHVPGAHLIPLSELSTRHTEVPTDQEVYVVCGGGGRSAAATEALNGAGYRAVNVAGGTRGWIDAGNPVVKGAEPN